MNNDWNLGKNEYRYVYGAVVGGMFITILIRSGFLSCGMSNLGVNLNRKMMSTLFRKPMSYFDSNPLGAIINRITKELLDIDIVFNNLLNLFMANFSQFTSVVILISVFIPFMIPVFIVISFLIVNLWKTSTLVSADINRITQTSASPVTSNFAEMFNGAVIIRSYDKSPYLKYKFEGNLSKLMKSEIFEKYVENWVTYRVELLSVCVIFFTAFFIFGIKALPFEGLLNVASLSLALSWGTSTSDLISFMLFCFSEVMKGMSSVQRILEVAESKDIEADYRKPKAPEDWPSSGKINIHNLCMRYRPSLPLVLNKVSFSAAKAEKIGIVGRTGSGKSSLILSLMRIVEMADVEEHGGYISIDGVKIDQVGLMYARSALTLIPQDAFVMSGTVASNIDPYKKHSRAELIEVLRKTRLIDSLQKDVLDQEGGEESLQRNNTKSSKGKDEPLLTPGESVSDGKVLDLVIEAGGANLSQGQRQLVCIARALVRKPKVLLMDEATASIDTKTDEIIQELLRNEFRNTTIMTIAHRLNTIIQYDKILSLKDGTLVEFDSPTNLLKNEESFFYGLVSQQGPEFLEKMKKLANSTKSEM